MRVAELILVQPDGKVKRLVLQQQDDDQRNDNSMIASLCDAMMDHEFRSGLSEADEEGARRLKAIWTAPRQLAKG